MYNVSFVFKKDNEVIEEGFDTIPRNDLESALKKVGEDIYIPDGVDTVELHINPLNL